MVTVVVFTLSNWLFINYYCLFKINQIKNLEIFTYEEFYNLFLYNSILKTFQTFKSNQYNDMSVEIKSVST
jgi:hypothetical protein